MNTNETPRPKPTAPKVPNAVLIEGGVGHPAYVVGIHGVKNMKFPKAVISQDSLEEIEDNTKLKSIVGHEVVPVKEKPKYVRKPHLTERPFQSHEGLQALQKQLASEAPKRGQRPTKKEKK